MEENKINRIADTQTAFAYASDILMSHLNDSFPNEIANVKENPVLEQKEKENEAMILEKSENFSAEPNISTLSSKERGDTGFWILKKIRSSFYQFFK